MQLLKQVWTLINKDLLIVGRRSWFSTISRALILPAIVTFVLGYVKVLQSESGTYGIQEPFVLPPLSDALNVGSRSKFVIVDRRLPGDDVRAVIDQLSAIVRRSNKHLYVVDDAEDLLTICPASNRGITDCFGAVDFSSSPDQRPGATWNYTMYFDSVIGDTFDATSQENSIQIYLLPLQHTIDTMIANAHGGPALPGHIEQYGISPYSEAQKNKLNRLDYDFLIAGLMAWALFVAVCGSTYHLAGYIADQRESGLLQLIDAMMPNRHKWECVAARILSTHLAFDLIYAPGWIAMGAITGGFTFPETGAAWCILLYVLTGLALSSYSILVASLFKRVQLAAISAVIAGIVFAIAAQFGETLEIGTTSMAGVWALAILFPPSTFVYFIVLSAFTKGSFSITGNQAYIIPGSNTHSLTGAVLFGFLVFQIILYPILGGIIEMRLHGHSSRGRHLLTKHEMGTDSVRLTGFSKHYNIAAKQRDRIRAVEGLSLNLYAGSITVLLGSNGSGKTTTLNAIAGVETITSGSIDIDATGGIGLCPQKNVHWDDMSVQEHVRFFEQLKRPLFQATQSDHEVERIIAGCDLEGKKYALAKTLSGGQMRKLQLAMMLAGGSQVCCIDEASSGIDPLARRKVWDILLQERGQRTMLLTTHFLDETEVLSDHVAILSKGKLKAEGSVASLKNQFGGGYHVILSDHDSVNILGKLPQGVTLNQEYDGTVLQAPEASMLAPLVAALDEFDVSDYRIRGPTVQDVFLNLAEEMMIGQAEGVSGTTRHTSDSDMGNITHEQPVQSALKLNTGRGCGPLKQIGLLFLKRVTILKHNFMPYIVALFVPLVLAGMVTRFSIDKRYPNGLPCAAPGEGPYSSHQTISVTELSYGGVFGPSNKASPADLTRLIPNPPNPYGYYGYASNPRPNWDESAFVNSLDDFNRAMQASVDDWKAYRSGGFYIGPQVVFAFQGTSPQYALQAQAALHMLLLNQTFTLNMASFQQAFLPDDFVQGLVAIISVLGFTIYPGLFALYPTAERLRNVRAMQYSNGIASSSLWVAYALFDFIFIIVISVFTVVIWAACYQGWYALEYVFVVLMLYGIAATVYSYVISMCVKSELAAMACTSLVQSVIATLVLVGYVVTINNAPSTQIDNWFNYVYFTVGLISPSVSLLKALLITLNVYSLACTDRAKAGYPGGITLFGGPILYLTLQIIGMVALLTYLESGRSLEVFGIRRKRSRSIVEEINYDSDQDVIDDEKHLASSKDGLRLFNLTKSFKAHRAVENVSLGILPSEKMALLGCNGAGKSTIISLIRGEIEPDSTDPPAAVYISGDSLMQAPVAAKNHLGVCPQFDGVDSMTLSEHLHFYARARGVPDKNTNINELISALGLTDHAHKLVKKLSGATKRKLSLAIALIANPSVLLLDEPSSGMDPSAKRAFWRTLARISAGRSVLLTTHSMEEASAICDRAGIMATRMLALGTIPDLCARHGDKIYIHIVHQDAPYTSATRMEALRRWTQSTFEIAEAEQRNFGGQLRFAIPVHSRSKRRPKMADGSNMGRLFRILEDKKVEMGIRDYSIGPATLDEVFLNVVTKHDVAEENSAPYRGRRGIVSRLRRRACSA